MDSPRLSPIQPKGHTAVSAATESDTSIDFLYLSEPDMIRAGVTNMTECVDTMSDMLGLFAAGDYRMVGTENNSHGAQIFFPEEELFPGMPVDGPDRRFMAMPAYPGGDYQVTGCKWYGSNVENKKRGLPRSILMFTLSDKDLEAAVRESDIVSIAVPSPMGSEHYPRVRDEWVKAGAFIC